MNEAKRSGLSGVVLKFVLCVAIALAGLFFFAGNFKVLTLLCAVAAIISLLIGKTEYLRHPVSLLLLGYVLVAGLSGIWAIAGKFFLKEYVKIFAAACMFIAVLAWKKFDRNTVRTLFGGMSVVSAIYCFLNIEFVTTGIVKQWIEMLIPAMSTVNYAVEGTRVYGIFGAPNAMATFVAFAIFFSIALLTDEKKNGLRLCWAATLAINAFVFLTMFSLAGTVFFLASVLVYLLTAGKKRGAVLAHMFMGAIPSVLWVVVAFSFFGAEGVGGYIPMLALLGNVACVMVLEQIFSGTLVPVLEKYGKIAITLLVVFVVAAGGYLSVAMNTSEAYTFGGRLDRVLYLEPGTHTVSIQATGEVSCIIQSQNETDAVLGVHTTLCNSSETQITFDVPDDSRACFFRFSAETGVILEEALLDGERQIHLSYTMIPAFIADRLQGFFANDSVAQRMVFFEDGMELFYQAPVFGLGVGSFETALTSVQEYHYETKYIHNHYIQVLQECGVLGFIPYLAGLLGVVWLLWKQRKKDSPIIDGGFGALCAAMAMMLGHTTFEFSMSVIIFTCFIFLTFAIIIRCALSPEMAEAEDGDDQPEELEPKDKKDLAVRGICIGLIGVFTLSLCLNLFANYLRNRPETSEHNFMQNLEASAKVDPYEKNDAMLSYVVAAVQSEQQHRYLDRANEFASRLQQVQSNTIPHMLLQYYLLTDQPYEAVDAALAGARYSATDSDKWNEGAYIFRDLLFRSPESLLFREGKPFIDSMMTYYATLQQHNEASLENIVLTTASKDFFGKIRSLDAGDGTREEILKVLATEMFRLDTACDSDQDHIPDQVSRYTNLTFNEDGSISSSENAWLRADLYCEYAGPVQIVVECEDPSSISVSSGNYFSVTERRVENGCVVIDGEILSLADGGFLPVQVTSNHAQKISQIHMFRIG